MNPMPVKEDEREAMERLPRYQRQRRGNGGLSKLALAISCVALIVSCVTLALLLRPVPEPDEPPEEPVQQEPETPTLQFRSHILPILENVPVNEYDPALFERDDAGLVHYLDAPLGVDVSSYQGEIDWEQVAGAGIQFAMLRCGARGYTKGGLMPDESFRRNIEGALAAGLEVGVYFFSQAIDPQEAREEAAYALELIGDYDVTYPVVFDWEIISGAEARTDSLSPEEVTDCAEAFCSAIAEAGFTPAIYFNLDQGYMSYQLDRLTDRLFWLAEYQLPPGFYYHFDLWQYTHQGSVPGIEGAVDLDLDLRSAAG